MIDLMGNQKSSSYLNFTTTGNTVIPINLSGGRSTFSRTGNHDRLSVRLLTREGQGRSSFWTVLLITVLNLLC